MKWFKHMADMSEDPRIKRLVRRFGADGYSVYVYIIERIVRHLDADSWWPELEENAEDIAWWFGLESSRVEAIIKYLIEVGLLEANETTRQVLCRTIYKFIDQTMSGNPQIRAMIAAYRDHEASGGCHPSSGSCHPSSGSCHDLVSPDVDVDVDVDEKKNARVRHGAYVLLTEDEYAKLCERYGKRIADSKIEDLDNYIGVNPPSRTKKYKSHYRTLLTWIKRDAEQGKLKLPTERRRCPSCGAVIHAENSTYCPSCGETLRSAG